MAKADPHANVSQSVGALFRVGYYSPQDGLDCIWLVDEDGEYCETVDRKYLEKYCELVLLTHESDYYGANRTPIKALTKAEKKSLVGKSPTR